MKRIAQRPFLAALLFLGGALICAFMAQTNAAGHDPQAGPGVSAAAAPETGGEYGSPPNDHCTAILVGQGASADGSVMATHTADCGMCDWTWRKVPAADHKPGEMRKLYHVSQTKAWPPKEGSKWDLIKKDFTGVEIPQPAHTYGYMHGVFGYLNDQSLAFGESTIGTVRKLENSTPAAKTDLTMLTLLAMERCRTAREAMAFMGGLAEKYGYGFVDSGEMLAVTDPK
ncbi:MAG: C69 family dipeptidase, partial [Candidatus Aminicenantales bacterium]